eukprot:m.163427 g.163427  ORF g.163427 m.163427 type:complete len:94 (+) comp14637_c1_seq2:88-369(+)
MVCKPKGAAVTRALFPPSYHRGRFQESVSEDPFLNGAYAYRFVQGFQGAEDGVNTVKIAATCKHFYGCLFTVAMAVFVLVDHVLIPGSLSRFP